MSGEHTKGRLIADDGDGEHFGVFAENGEPIAYLIEPAPSARHALLPRDETFEANRAKAPGLVRFDVTYTRYAEHKANARRLVVCWNACEGMPTEQVEAIVPLGIIKAARLGDCMQDRDELIAALRVAETWLRPSGASGGHKKGWAIREDHDRICALLAKHAPKVPE